jgi:hypothetical protein
MDELDAGTLTTHTLTHTERLMAADALTLLATIKEALDDLPAAREALKLWERFCPDYGV